MLTQMWQNDVELSKDSGVSGFCQITYRKQLIVSGDDLSGEAGLLCIKWILPIQHGIQNDSTAPYVRFLLTQESTSFKLT